MPHLSPARARQKAKVLQTVRSFFESQNFLEVDTPILQKALVPELHVASFELSAPERNTRSKSGSYGYLLPSPELAMKQLLCDWQCRAQNQELESLPFSPPCIFQLAHCFRREEQQDLLHRQEFLMLEFYAVGKWAQDSRQLLCLVSQLLAHLGEHLRPELASVLCGEGKGSSKTVPQILSFEELCQRALGLGFDCYWQDGIAGLRELYLLACEKRSGFRTLASTIEALSLDDLFHLFLVEFLEPHIERHLPYCALYPYPDVTPLPARSLSFHSGAGLAAGEAGGGWVERWELYLNGVELANACAEENRPEYLARYRQRFARELKCAGREAESPCFDWVALDFWQNLPDCGGVALGLDRLLAL